MATTTSARKPNYFLMVFGAGLPNPPEGGVYPLEGGRVLGSGVISGGRTAFVAESWVSRHWGNNSY